MALSEKHRSSIYTKLAPMLGEEETQELLSQFPARDLDEPVTKEFVRSEGLVTRSELRAEMADMRSELRAEMADMRSELVTRFDDAITAQTRWVVGTIVGAGAIYTAIFSTIAALT